MAPLFPEYVPNEHQEAVTKLRTLAKDLQGAMTTTLEKYVAICEHIRVSQMMPTTLRTELSALGFASARISEIQRVALVSDEVWAQYKSRAIGFKVTLELARKEKMEEEERKAAAEAARNSEFALGEMPAEETEPAPEAKSAAKSVEIEKTKTSEPVKADTAHVAHVKPRKTVGHENTPASVTIASKYPPWESRKRWLYREALLQSRWIFEEALEDMKKLPPGWKPQTNFDVNGWRVEVRITRAKQTKKPAKKTTTKTKKGKK